MHCYALDDSRPHPIFLSPKAKLKLERYFAWFSLVHAGCNILGLLIGILTKDIPKLVGKKILDKYGKVTTFAKLRQATVPMEYAMKVPRHHKSMSYLSKGYM